jgi:O-acetyl-ADP-ribose deacetylase (regulator of RNase III)
MTKFKIHLRDRNPEMATAWKLLWKNHPAVEISSGDIFEVEPTDAIVSPANSFGFMDGGIDGYYSYRWPRVQEELQKFLANHHYGELPVGNAVIIPIPHGDENTILPGPWKRQEGQPDFKWLISAPTMRIPMDITGTVNAYLAFRAALIALLKHNEANDLEPERQITSILCPGLGTAIGKLEPKVAALQMHMAYKHILEEPLQLGSDLGNAWNMHDMLRRGVG